MRIVLASSEAVPFSKTGGLADVATALAKSLAERGHDVFLVVPNHHRHGRAKTPPMEPTGKTVAVPVAAKTVTGAILQTRLPGSDVTFLLIDQPAYFDRPGLYQDDGADYPDNCERFSFFSRAVMEACRVLEIAPDVIHANDWQTGLVPALLNVEYSRQPAFAETAGVFTIHNMAFQGRFWHWDMLLTGLDWKYFNWKQMEYFGDLNLMKTGVVFADMVTTVSPTYATEIQTAEYGAGLDGVLRSRAADLVGILNGVDTDVWDPQTDAALPRNYAAETVTEGKSACKRDLQGDRNLEVRDDVPLFGMISRMTAQKGLDLISQCADRMLRQNVQLSFLGRGDGRYEQFLTDLSTRYPRQVSTTIGFDEELAHRIEAAADAYLMPSRFEPCGLNQMYSLRYGTVPIVRSVGGLADSVVDTNDETLAERRATGFRFDEYRSAAFSERFDRAVELYRDKNTWKQLAQTGMRQDLSWNRSAAEYETVYRRARDKAARRSREI
ncbi:MAG: glycogen synthase GlgA [Planctomycetaceae bacterium]